MNKAQKIYRQNIDTVINLATDPCNRFFSDANNSFFRLLATLFGKTYVRRVNPGFKQYSDFSVTYAVLRYSVK